MKPKNTICLWFDKDALDAARFYAATFPESQVTSVHSAPSDYPSGKKGDVLTVTFTVVGLPCLVGVWRMQRLGVTLFLAFSALMQVVVWSGGHWGVFSLVVPTLVAVVGVRWHRAMSDVRAERGAVSPRELDGQRAPA